MSRRRYDDDDRPAAPSGAGPFGWGFGLTCGVVAAVLLVVVGVPALCCGLGGLGIFRAAAVHDKADRVKAEKGVKAAQQVAQQPAPDNKQPKPQDADKSPPGKPLLEVGDSLLFGEVRASVTGVSFDFVPLKAFRGTGKSADKLLMVNLLLQNSSATKKVSYRGWQPDLVGFGDLASLEDDLGNHYKRITFGIDKVVGRAQQGESIYPGKELADVLVFEEPIADCHYLILTLPGSALGADKEAKFRIPRNAWDK